MRKLKAEAMQTRGGSVEYTVLLGELLSDEVQELLDDAARRAEQER